MEKFVIVGAGATGRAVARSLEEQQADVVMVSRSGSGADLPGVRAIAGDATDAGFLGGVADGASAIFNCVNPPYHRWMTDWPPIAAAILDAARRSGAVLTTLSNLYAYGPPDGPMRTSDPLISTLPKAQVRAQMWTDALEAHQRGEVRATEVRASDFIGSGSQSVFERGKKALLAQRSVSVFGNPDMVHSWTFTGDVGRTLVAASTNPVAWGQAWHAVTNEPRTMRQVYSEMAAAAGVREPRLRPLPVSILKAIGTVSPMVRELPKTMYQFDRPFVIDDTETRTALRLKPTEWATVISDAVGR